MKKFALLAACLGVSLMWSTSASAATIGFNPGTGFVSVDRLDWDSGNSLVVEDLDRSGNTTGTGTVYFQSNLDSAIQGVSNTTFNNGDSNIYVTAVAQFNYSTLSPGVLAVDPGGVLALYVNNT